MFGPVECGDAGGNEDGSGRSWSDGDSGGGGGGIRRRGGGGVVLAAAPAEEAEGRGIGV
jgi:hypothetical protein